MGIFDRLRSTGQDATRLIEQGHALEAEGRLDEAMQCYLDAIRLAPNPARAHLNRGNILLLKGDLPAALDAFRTAIQHKPDYAGAYYNIGNALLGNKQLDEAVASYRQALEIEPDYAEVHCSLGVALKELGQLDSAIESFQRALQINPDLVEAHTNLGNVAQELYSRGNVLLDNGKLDDAVATFHSALGINPDLVEAHNNLAIALQELGRSEDAAASYRQALKIRPDYAEAHFNLGNTLRGLRQFEGAAASHRRALELKPDFAEAHNNLGIALQELGRSEDAAASYRQALHINPEYAEAHFNLGNTLKSLRQFEGAVASYRRALEIIPEYTAAYSNLGNALKDFGQLDDALACYRMALELQADYLEAHTGLLFTLNYMATCEHSQYLEQARQYGRIVSGKVGSRFPAWQCATNPERLRVGLMSGDFRKHSVGFFLEGMLSHIDPARIELIAYPTHHKEDELTARIRPCFSAWKPLVGLSDEAAARLIHADGVHVLIDLSGHTAHNRLPVFAWKPAPVQVTWLGLPATTGVAEIDYVLGDLQAIPTEHEGHFTETVWRLPDSYVCFSPPVYPLKVAPLPALAAGQVTFGSFNNLTKMTDQVVAVWARILLSVPGSRLYLKAGQLIDEGIRGQTLQRFAACGISPERLLLSGMMGTIADHLAEYNKVDIALDTFPYPGVTTSVEALWMGVPVLSLHGDRFLSLSAKSIAHHAGLPDWVAADEDDYVAKAVAFASDLQRLARLRAGLRQQVLASPLFDAPRFARNFEDALWGMWQRYQDKQENLKRV